MANVLTPVTMAAVTYWPSTAYANASTPNVSPATAYRWKQSGLATSAQTAAISGAAAVNVKARSATINLAGPAQISQPADWWVEYGKTTSYGQRSSVAPNTVAASTPDSISLFGLQSNTLYHYRVVAVGAFGRVNGADLTFTTLAQAPNP